MKRFDISVLGELNCDLILYGLPAVLEPEREHLANDFALTLGSSSAIFAHNISLLGSRVGFASCIGGDPLGKFCVERLSESGVDVSGVKLLPSRNTGVTVILPLAEKRHILTYPGTTFDLDLTHLNLDYLRDAAHFHVSSFFLLRADPDNLWADDVKAALKSVDVFLPNEHEACKTAGTGDVDSALDILSHLVPVVVIKCGAQGVLAKRGKERFRAGSLPVQPVDAVGAGDSFNAGFLHKFIRGAGLQDCLEFGNVSAGLSTTRAGGTEAFRDHHHREAFLQRYANA